MAKKTPAKKPPAETAGAKSHTLSAGDAAAAEELPQVWYQEADGSWTTDDQRARMFGEAVWFFTSQKCNLAEIDNAILAAKEGPRRDAMIRKRVLAYRYMLLVNGCDWGLVHELLDALMRELCSAAREEVLLPLARTGEKVRMGGVKGGNARKEPDPDRAACTKRATIEREAADYAGAARAKVATIARKTGATPQYIRKVLREIGNGKPL